MALVKCKRCGTNMLAGAATCPGCGTPAARGMSSKKVLLLLGGLGVCLLGTCLLGVVVVALKRGEASQANSGPVEYMMLSTLLSEYRDNELRADSKFKGHIVEVTGYVQDIKKDLLNLPYVTIGSGPALEIPKVQCFLTSEHAQKATSLSKGLQATVRGRVEGLMGNVLLKDCELH